MTPREHMRAQTPEYIAGWIQRARSLAQEDADEVTLRVVGQILEERLPGLIDLHVQASREPIHGRAATLRGVAALAESTASEPGTRGDVANALVGFAVALRVLAAREGSR